MTSLWTLTHEQGTGSGGCAGSEPWPRPPALTLVEDVHTGLVGADDLQDPGVRGQHPDDVPVVLQQPLHSLLLRDALGHHQAVLDLRLGGPVEGGVVDLCRRQGAVGVTTRLRGGGRGGTGGGGVPPV